jgi:hypothetical protein
MFGHFSPLPSPPPLTSPPCPHLLATWQKKFALISNFVEESIRNNRKEQGFLLVVIRVAIQ